MITNYSYHETGGSEQNYCITQDHRGVLYVGNYEKGILEYDGVAWRNISMPNNVPVWSMVTGDDGVVYVGAEGNMGLLEPDSRGELHFRSLLDSTLKLETPDFSVWKTYFNDGKVWFCSHTGIFVYHPKTGGLESLATPEDAYHSYMVKGRLYISDYAHGLMILEGDQFTKVAGGEFFHEKSITGMDLLDKNNMLISTYENGIYILNTLTGQIEDNFLDEVLMDEFRSGIITFTMLRDQDLLVCTYSNGLYILDLEGRVKEIISETEGLIDNTVIQVYTENNQSGSGPIWIANWKGVSKVESNNPFRVFTESSGFENLITDIVRFKGTLFVSTMNGLFYKDVAGDQTIFKKVNDIGNNVHDLQLISPSRWREFLLVSTDREVYIINERKHVSKLKESLLTEDGIPVNRDQIGGRFLLNDPDQGDIIFTGENRVVELQYYRGRWKQNSVSPMLNDEIHHMTKDRYGNLWVSTATKVIRIDLELAPAITVKAFSAEHGLPLDENTKVFLNPLSKNLMVGTYNGFYRFNYFQERFLPDSLFNSVLPPGRNTIRTFYHDIDGDYWYSFENENSGWTEMLLRLEDDQLKVLADKPFLRLPSAASADLFYSDRESGIWFSKSDELYHFDKSFSKPDSLPFQTLIRKVLIDGDSVLFNGTNYKPLGKGRYTIHKEQLNGASPFINFEHNNIGFHWAAPFFEQEDQIQYSYYLEGFSKSWSEWQKTPFVEFINLKYGKYTLQLKAKNIYDTESLPCSYTFVIRRPWYATYLAIISYFLLSVLLVYLLVRLYTFRLKRENIRLEGIIGERTAKIRHQKKELTDSIEYASRIQSALLPSIKLLEEREIEHFIRFRPRDIVSGDFYWMGNIEQIDDILVMGLRFKQK